MRITSPKSLLNTSCYFTIYTVGICFWSMYQMSGRGIQFIKNRDFWLFLFKDKWARFSTQIVTHTLLVINDDKRILWQPHSADKSHFLLDSSKQVNINASWREKLFHGNYPILRITSEEDQNCELKKAFGYLVWTLHHMKAILLLFIVLPWTNNWIFFFAFKETWVYRTYYSLRSTCLYM